MKGSLITPFPMMNRLWVTPNIWWKASSHFFWQPTVCEWHCTFYERQSDHIFSHDQQQVSDMAHFVKGNLITFLLWPTASEWHQVAHFVETQSDHIFSYDQQRVSPLHIVWKAVSSKHLFLQTTGCEWHCTFCERLSHHISSYDQQQVSDIAHVVKSHLFIWPTASEWYHTLCERQYDYIFAWPTASEWHCWFCERQSDHIFPYDQQPVNYIAHVVKGSLITSFPITNREWVTLQILWKAVSSHLFLLSTACEWHCRFWERQAHHIFSYDQQRVSDIEDFMKGNLITSFPIIDRLWVTLHMLSKAVSWFGGLITSFLTYDQLQLVSEFHMLWKTISSRILLWLKGSEWHCTFQFERQSHDIFSHI